MHFCEEARSCDDGLHRQIEEMGHDSIVGAPSLIPVKSDDRVKTHRRDAVMLTKLHLTGALTAVRVRDAAHEAMRDLVRARVGAIRVKGKARSPSQRYLLRHGRIYPGQKGWTVAYRRRMTAVCFKHPAQQILFQNYVDADDDALSTGMHIDWTSDSFGQDGILVVVEPNRAGLRDRSWLAVKAAQGANVRDEVGPHSPLFLDQWRTRAHPRSSSRSSCLPLRDGGVPLHRPHTCPAAKRSASRGSLRAAEA